MTTKKVSASKQASKQASEISKLTLIARGRVNLDFNSELDVISRAANVIVVENDKRFFNETLAHICARVTKYVDSLELLRGEQMIARVTCESVPREEVKISEKSTTSIYLDEVKAARRFKLEYLDQETDKLESEIVDTEVREWKYRRDERRNEFISQLKIAIDKVDSSLVSLKQASTLSQAEIKAQAEIADLKAQLKAKRDHAKALKAERQAS